MTGVRAQSGTRVKTQSVTGVRSLYVTMVKAQSGTRVWAQSVTWVSLTV